MKDLVSSYLRNGTQADHYVGPNGAFPGTLNPGFLISVVFRDSRPEGVAPAAAVQPYPIVGNLDAVNGTGWQVVASSESGLLLSGADNYNVSLLYFDGGNLDVLVDAERNVTVDPVKGAFITPIRNSLNNRTQVWHIAFGLLDTAGIQKNRVVVMWHNGVAVGQDNADYPVVASYSPAGAGSPLRVLAQDFQSIFGGGKGANWAATPGLGLQGFGIAPLPVAGGETDMAALGAFIARHTEACMNQRDFANDAFFNTAANTGAYSVRRGNSNLANPWPPAIRDGVPAQGNINLTRTLATGVDMFTESAMPDYDDAFFNIRP